MYAPVPSVARARVCACPFGRLAHPPKICGFEHALTVVCMRAHAFALQAVLEMIKEGTTDTVIISIKRELAGSKKSGFGVVQRT